MKNGLRNIRSGSLSPAWKPCRTPSNRSLHQMIIAGTPKERRIKEFLRPPNSFARWPKGARLDRLKFISKQKMAPINCDYELARLLINLPDRLGHIGRYQIF